MPSRSLWHESSVAATILNTTLVGWSHGNYCCITFLLVCVLPGNSWFQYFQGILALLNLSGRRFVLKDKSVELHICQKFWCDYLLGIMPFNWIPCIFCTLYLMPCHLLYVALSSNKASITVQYSIVMEYVSLLTFFFH